MPEGLNFLEEFMLSGVAAVVSKTISAPIERVKMVVQNQEEMIRKGTLEARVNVPGAFKWIASNEGVPAFWKSNFTNCLRYFPTQALNFSFKGLVKDAGLKPGKGEKGLSALAKNIAGGGIAGGGSLTFVYSLDYARTRLSNDLKGKGGGEREFTGLADVYKKTFAADGIAGLYRGFNISFVGIFIYRGLYFGMYDTATAVMPEDTGVGVKFLVGYAVTVLSGLASYPIDTIRRRMMMTSGSKELQYKNSFDAAQQIMKAEGAASFMKGAGANILRGVAGAGVLSGFDVLKKNYLAYKLSK